MVKLSKHKKCSTPPTCLPSSVELSNWERLDYICFFTIFVNSQFLLLKYYRLQHYGVSYNLFSLIWNPLYLTNSEVTKSQLEWAQLKLYKIWNKKRSVKEMKMSIKRCRVFKIALKGGKNGNFVMLKGTFNKHWLIRISITCVYIKPEIKRMLQKK